MESAPLVAMRKSFDESLLKMSGRLSLAPVYPEHVCLIGFDAYATLAVVMALLCHVF